MFIYIKYNGRRWVADLVKDYKIIQQLSTEAGLSHDQPDANEAYDKLLSAAGKHGIGLETDYIKG